MSKHHAEDVGGGENNTPNKARINKTQAFLQVIPFIHAVGIQLLQVHVWHVINTATFRYNIIEKLLDRSRNRRYNNHNCDNEVKISYKKCIQA